VAADGTGGCLCSGGCCLCSAVGDSTVPL